MKINLVTGATGFIGRYLVERLLEEGETVYAIVRKNENNRSLSSRFNVLKGDITNKNIGLSSTDLDQLSKNEVIIWHLAANLSFKEEEKTTIFETNINGTKNVIQLANKFAKKIYYMGTAYVCGDRLDTCLEDELEKGQKHRNMYEETKYKAETLFHTKCKIPFVIFRPSIAIGNTYKGKALGCTFGYYRFTHLFFFLKNKIKKSLNGKSKILANVFKILGTTYDKKTDTLSVPWLIMPYPLHATVDLIPVDYLVDVVVSISKKDFGKRTFHITNPQPPEYIFFLKALVEDLKFEKMKYVGMPKALFKLLFQTLYFIIPPIQKYIYSVLWYMPYITQNTCFDRRNLERTLQIKFPFITRTYMKKINEYAREEIYNKIEI